MAEAVKIAIRTRPFNNDEKAQNDKLCLQMTDCKVTVNDLEGGKKPREFTFDHAMWSHDGARTREDGYHEPDGPGSQYCDQDKAWEMLGNGLLDKAWSGLNVTMFAYGQTGSGKSYTMFGAPGNRGVVPTASDKIFERISQNTNPDETFQVTVQMVEIYMEKIQDLFVEPSKRGAPLKIRERNKNVYVEGVQKKAVSNYAQMERWMSFGDKNRSIGGTAMNASSSRSHTVFTVELVKITKFGEKKSQTNATINLVDLAGSEKQGQAKTEGDRLKEGNAINKSLSSLGNVISVLADNSDPSKKKKPVPYRDSELTRMLQQALGGNSSTIMVCAIRPGFNYYEETLNTLKYADRAKKIKNKPTINESEQDKIIRTLRLENERLKAELAAGGGGGGGGAALDPEVQRKLEEAQAEIERNRQQLAQMEDWDKQLAASKAEDEAEEARKKEEEEARNSGRPQLLNLHEDGMLDRKIFLDLSKQTEAKVGRKNVAEPDKNPHITLGGIGIQHEHACFVTTDEGTSLKPLCEGALQQVTINGQKLTSMDEVKLKANDRIIFGTSSAFLFRNQDRAGESEVQDEPQNPVTYEFAMREKSEQEDAASAAQKEEERRKQEEETAAKIAEINAKAEAEKAEQAALQKKMQEEHEAALAKLKAEIEAKQDDEAAQKEAQDREIQMRLDMEMKLEQEKLKAAKEEAERQERIRKETLAIERRQAEFTQLEKQLGELLPKVNEANQIADQFGRKITFNARMHRDIPTNADDIANQKTSIIVKVDNNELGYYYPWGPEKFEDRLMMIREHLNDYFETNKIPDFSDQEQDPFWDPPKAIQIGVSFISLKMLAYVFDNEVEVKIFSSEGSQAVRGAIKLAYYPCDESGEGEVDDELIAEDEDPRFLLGKDLYFRFEIQSAKDLPKDLCLDTYVTYELKSEPSKQFQTEIFGGQCQTPVYNYKKVHLISPVTDYYLDWMEKDQITVKVWGNPIIGSKQRPQQAQLLQQPQQQQQQQQQKQATSNAATSPNMPVSSKQSSQKSVAFASDPIPIQGGDAQQNGNENNKSNVIAVAEGKKASACCTIF